MAVAIAATKTLHMGIRGSRKTLRATSDQARQRLVRDADQWRGSGGTGRFPQRAPLVLRGRLEPGCLTVGVERRPVVERQVERGEVEAVTLADLLEGRE